MYRSYLTSQSVSVAGGPEYCVKCTSVIRFLNVNLYLLGKDNVMYSTLNLMHSTFVPIVTKAARSHTFTFYIPAQFYFEEVSTC